MPLINRTHKGILDSFFGKTSVFGALATAPTIYVGLSSTTPTQAGTNVTEPSGAGAEDYARVATAAGDWNAATEADPAVLDNLNAIAFPELTTAGQNWGTLTHFVLFDAATAGNVIGWGALGTSKNPTLGDTPTFGAGDLDVNLRAPA